MPASSTQVLKHRALEDKHLGVTLIMKRPLLTSLANTTHAGIEKRERSISHPCSQPSRAGWMEQSTHTLGLEPLQQRHAIQRLEGLIGANVGQNDDADDDKDHLSLVSACAVIHVDRTVHSTSTL